MAPSSPIQTRRPSLANRRNVMVALECPRLEGSVHNLEGEKPLTRFLLRMASLSTVTSLIFMRTKTIKSTSSNATLTIMTCTTTITNRTTAAMFTKPHSDIEEEQYEVKYPTLPNPSQYHQHQYQQQQLLPPSSTTHQPTNSHPPGLVHLTTSRGLAYLAMTQVLGPPMYHQVQVLSQYSMHLVPAHIFIPASKAHVAVPDAPRACAPPYGGFLSCTFQCTVQRSLHPFLLLSKQPSPNFAPSAHVNLLS
ncbi:hypothetical protein BT96DRAFT_568649 [Gymnopus androsaceus JB14]|uniref:Uncharacterized protein n=1 Tax=Gymnopus androsaceus JB14 TaxID=1447944 RepID=A0A6A4HUW5_9AGAR|nr:hypothetical protein BT96DRAFT_568649 [Gymnopus androsaceus JB14]